MQSLSKILQNKYLSIINNTREGKLFYCALFLSVKHLLQFTCQSRVDNHVSGMGHSCPGSHRHVGIACETDHDRLCAVCGTESSLYGPVHEPLIPQSLLSSAFPSLILIPFQF